MAQLDSTLKWNRSKQIAFWNLRALSDVHSISEMVVHSPYPKLYTEKDRDWRNLYYLQHLYYKGKQVKETFISRSKSFIQNGSTFDRLTMNKAEVFNLSVIKHEFWNRVYRLKPVTKQDSQSRSIVRNIVWKERFLPYSFVILSSTLINAISGIAMMRASQRVVTYAVLFLMAQFMVRIKQSDAIFYKITTLPSPQLEAERQMILQDSLILDGTINSYGLPVGIYEELEAVSKKQKSEEERRDILEAMGYNLIE